MAGRKPFVRHRVDEEMAELLVLMNRLLRSMTEAGRVLRFIESYLAH
jgi:hypothetical protein